MKNKQKYILPAMLAAMSLAQTVQADETIQDDLIVVGSACLGVDCQAGKDFGFDTLQLISASPQISFVDTSSSSAFPTNDWKMGVTANEANVSYFYVQDAEAGSIVMKLAATENGGVALGAGSTLEANAVSVGSDEVKRRITQVADGVNATDAATLGQLQQLQTTFDPQATELESQLAELLSRIDALSTRLDDLQ